MSFLSSIFGIGRGKPGQTVMTQKLPEEIAPFAKEMLEEAQTLYKQKLKEGYADYKGDTIAGFTPEQKQAMEGIKGLVGTSAPLMDEAIGLTKGLTDQFTAEEAQKYMSPYQQAVTDIEKREAQKVFERDIMPQFEKQAVEAGGMSGMGSRAGLQAALLGEAQMRQQEDIQTKGSQRAYDAAVRQFQNQKERERLAASGLMEAGPKKFKAGMLEQGALQTVGEQKQDLAQTALDEAYLKFIQKQQYPAEQLAQYSGFITMNPYAGLKSQTTTATPYKPSFGQQLLSIGTQLGGAYLGGPGGTQFGKFMGIKAGGGAVGKGLSSLVYRDNGGRIDEADPSNIGAMQEADPLRARRTELESGLASLAQKEKALDYQKHNLRSPEEIQRLARERANERLALLESQGGGDKSFARQQIANLLKAASQGFIDPAGNFAKHYADITEADLKEQKANKAKRDAQELLNLNKKFAAEDEAYGIPAKLKAKIDATNLSKLDFLTKKAKLEKILFEIQYGNRRKGKPKIVNQKQAEDVWKYLTTVMKYSSDAKQNAQMVAIMEKLDEKEKLIIANEINAAKDSDANLGEHGAVIKAIKKLGPDFFAKAKEKATPGWANFWSDNPFKD
jgi:hypothetical protein